jgi:hypothetical protein
MEAFIPRGLPRSRQTIAYHLMPPVNRGTPSDGTEPRQVPDYGGGRLPDGTELRRVPEYGGGRLPDDFEVPQCPVSEGN